MKYQVGKDFIKVYSKEEFNPQHILECGQVFCYRKNENNYIVFPGDEYAEIFEESEFYLIKTQNPNFFVKWFDLENDYQKIKSQLSSFEIMNTEKV